jgi:SEC-C motif
MFLRPNKARERTPIHRAKGVTLSERYLNNLCERSFLSLWSYPGVFRDQKVGGRGNGKELCDMVVVFDRHVLIFSDKHCSFPESGNMQLDWQRWYKRAILGSADQAWGAERWLKKYPDRVYLDRACTQKFPLPIPPSQSARYHLIVVAHGSENRCKEEFGGSGSLMLNSSLGRQSTIDELSLSPFMIGDLDLNRTFVHVFTESTVNVLLQTLDTISDFVAYLEKKENLIRSGTMLSAPGEEDLLAFYLSRVNKSGAHDFVVEGDYNGVVLEEGFWEDFCNGPVREEQLRQNRVSYMWDGLIERFARHALNATQYYTNHTELSSTEIGLRFMARETRTARRLIAKGLIAMYNNTPDGMSRTKCLKSLSEKGLFYVFLSLPKPDFASYEQYREARFGLLDACCMIVKYRFPEALDIVGIASEPVRQNAGSSEDLLYLDTREWSDELNKEAAQLQEHLGILTSGTFYKTHENEYPEPIVKKNVRATAVPKVGRNALCPCGSGKKYKYCHGR